MRYINADMTLQDTQCELNFILHDEKLVNSIRFKSDPYVNQRGQTRQLDFYIPREVFDDAAVPDLVKIRISVDI